jgi:hypothetical protein
VRAITLIDISLKSSKKITLLKLSLLKVNQKAIFDILNFVNVSKVGFLMTESTNIFNIFMIFSKVSPQCKQFFLMKKQMVTCGIEIPELEMIEVKKNHINF